MTHAFVVLLAALGVIGQVLAVILLVIGVLALELVEDRVMRGIDRVAPVRPPDRDHVDRRLALLE